MQKLFIGFPSPVGEGLNPTSNKNNMNGVYFSKVGFKSGISVYLVSLMDSILAYSQMQSLVYLYHKVGTSCFSRGERADHWDNCHAKLLITLYLKITNF